MPKYRVYGVVSVGVSVEVDVDPVECDGLMEVLAETAGEEFGGITAFAGNGGSNKLIGVRGSNESIEPGDDIEWDDFEELT